MTREPARDSLGAPFLSTGFGAILQPLNLRQPSTVTFDSRICYRFRPTRGAIREISVYTASRSVPVGILAPVRKEGSKAGTMTETTLANEPAIRLVSFLGEVGDYPINRRGDSR